MKKNLLLQRFTRIILPAACKPLLCSPKKTKIIETQFNPVASHLTSISSKNMQTPWKRTFALLYFHPHNIPNPSGSAEVHHFLSSLKPNFELEALRQNGLHFFEREKRGVKLDTSGVHRCFFLVFFRAF